MTEAVNDRIKQVQTTGGELSVIYDFRIAANTHVKVEEEDLADVVKTLVLGTDYTVTGVGALGGGTIVFDTGVYPSGATAGFIYTMTGQTPLERLADFVQKGPLLAATLNAEQDAEIQILQQLERDLARKFGVPLSDGEVPPKDIPARDIRKGLFATYDSSGDPDVSTGTLPGGVPVSAYINTLLPATDDAAARGILLVGQTAQNQVNVYADDSGGGMGDIYAITLTPAVTAYVEGQRFAFQITNGPNTGASTLAVNGLAAIPIKKNGGTTDLEKSDLVLGQIVEVEYDGTNFQVVSAMPRKELRAPLATTSGGAQTYTGIPAWATRITVMLQDVSTDGTTTVRVRIGPIGGLVSTGYLGGVAEIDGAEQVAGYANAFDLVFDTAPGSFLSGTAVLNLLDATNNIWVVNGTTARSTGSKIYTFAGKLALSGVLTQVSLITGDTFDGGSFSILIE